MLHIRKSVSERVRRNVLLLLLFACCLESVVAYAQSTAQINGTVTDQTGAVLPGVDVTVLQTETGLTRTAVTDETGSYILTNLPVGPYRLEAALPGFRAYVQTGIVLQVNSNPSINAVLEVGQISDQVEVHADAALVETRSTGVGQVIDNIRVLELPLNGRRVSELIVLSGAAIAGGAQPVAGRSYPTESISVAGGMNNGLTYMLDGGVHNDPYSNLNLPLPFPDAMQEFKVETSAVPAQYGQHSAGAVNAVTKSGTNEFHGSLFEFVRNKVFNARNAFAVTRDGLKRNQFGGTFGGPIARNKLFFFGAYQATVQRSEPTDSREYVPTAAMLAGDWTTISSPVCNAGRQITLRAPFINNRIDPALFVTPALNLVKRLPATGHPCGEVRYGRRTNSDEHLVVGKVDYQRSDKHSLFGRYQSARLDTPQDYDGENLLTFKANNTHMEVQSLVLGDTYLLGSGIVSSFRGTLNRTVVEQVNPQDFFTLSDLGVKNIFYPPDYSRYTRLSITGGFAVGSGTTIPGVTNSTIFHFGEDLGFILGVHQLGFGASYINSRLNLAAGTLAAGTFSFGTTNTGSGLGDFMLGKPGTWSQGGITTYYYRQHYFALYLQDTWKANSRLTVNAGLRWEPYLPAWDKNGRIVRFDQKRFDEGVRSTVFKKAPAGLLFPGDTGIANSKSLSSSHWMHFAPRVGLAYDPSGDGRMTVRAAYGIFFDFPHFYQFNAQRDAPPWGSRVNLANPPGGFENPWQDYPGGNPYPVVVDTNVEFPSSGIYTNIPWDLKMPYAHQWNLSIQRQIGTDWLVSGNYLGSSVIHLMDSYEGNPAIYIPGASCVIAGRTYSPCSSTANTIQRRKLSLQNPAAGQYFGNLVLIDDGGTRSFNGLLLSIQRRRSRGVTVQANYTWSHCIDDGTKPMFQNSGDEILERRRLNRGNCESDRRHNFNLSTVYETPQFSSRALQALAGGWRVSGIFRILSGSYLTVSSGLDNALSATNDQRPDRALPNPYPAKQTTEQWLNPAAFAQPSVGTYGNMGPRSILGPGSIRLDMGLTRSFRVRESQSVEFRAEAFNVPNHLNPGNPITALNNANFSRTLSASDPRIIQLALKYVF